VNFMQSWFFKKILLAMVWFSSFLLLVIVSDVSPGTQYVFQKSYKRRTDSTCKEPIIVAVIDTGIDPYHEELTPFVWEAPGGGFGWNFVSHNDRPMDLHGHGTHVSGIIKRMVSWIDEEDNVGARCPVKIMALKYFSESNTSQMSIQYTIEAIRYAVENGAKIINYSSGGSDFLPEERDAILEANEKGVLFVSAAGNERADIDKKRNNYYPASYHLPNMVSVSAIDEANEHLIAASNWGKTQVDIAAPGNKILSTLPGNKYGALTGTSQATAFVSGLSARIWSRAPYLSLQEVRGIILSSVKRVPVLHEKVATGGMINPRTLFGTLSQVSVGVNSEVRPLAVSLAGALRDLASLSDLKPKYSK
jgi:subtilisin family serine protease